jgi:hypothetical protein
MAARQQRREQMTYVALVGLYMSLLGVFAARERDREPPFDLPPHDLGLLGLATFRAARIASYDLVAEPFRAPVTETVPDEFAAGENVIAEGTGARKALGELISCPTCVGTWVAAGFIYGMRLAPGPTRLVAAILGVSGMAELVGGISEALTWGGKAARKESAPES